MQKPLFVRPMTPEEYEQVAAGLRSADAFTLRRCQILLASARGEHTPQIARALGCSDQCVRNALHAFNTRGLGAVQPQSCRPKHVATAFSADAAARLRTLLHQSPRTFDEPTSVWSLPLAAKVAFAQGLTAAPVSGETVRATLARLGVRWQRAKEWITSPDPAYGRKKGPGTA
jgi:transposase